MRFASVALACSLCIAASPALGQYRNLEVSPNGRGGVQGTYGNQNFEIDGQSHGSASGHVGGRRPGTLTERPSLRSGSVGATQRRCYVDGNGNSYCE